MQSLPSPQVTWDSPDDTANPKNWSMKRKWAATLIVSCFTLVSPISSSMISPALASISRDFNITNEVEAQLTLQLSNLFYLAWNLGCGFAQTSGQLMAFRFLSGLGGSAPLAIGGVSLAL